MDLSVVPYNTSQNSGDISGAGRYRECLRNHAAALGGQAFDGCGEFMPSGSAGNLDALKCAACGCHRNFHRLEGRRHSPTTPLLLYSSNTNHSPNTLIASPPAFAPFYHAIQPPPVSAAPPPLAETLDRTRLGSETPPRSPPAPSAADLGGSAARKRFRTKFTAEQKEKMAAFAEKLGWRIQKHDDAALREFCDEIGVTRHVLKVWMHNNKHNLAGAGAGVDAGMVGDRSDGGVAGAGVVGGPLAIQV